MWLNFCWIQSLRGHSEERTIAHDSCQIVKPHKDTVHSPIMVKAELESYFGVGFTLEIQKCFKRPILPLFPLSGGLFLKFKGNCSLECFPTLNSVKKNFPDTGTPLLRWPDGKSSTSDMVQS